jgi:predicted PurR-regulated permease PerM
MCRYQDVSLIQQIQQAQEAVQDYPKFLEDHTRQLNDLLNALRLIEEEKELQTAGMIEQLAKVLEISEELQGFLGEMALSSMFTP